MPETTTHGAWGSGRCSPWSIKAHSPVSWYWPIEELGLNPALGAGSSRASLSALPHFA